LTFLKHARSLPIRIKNSQYSIQNRHQKVFNRGVLRLCGGICVCAGRLDILKIDKNSTDLLCFMFQFGGLEVCLGAKPPVATELTLLCLCTLRYSLTSQKKIISFSSREFYWLAVLLLFLFIFLLGNVHDICQATQRTLFFALQTFRLIICEMLKSTAKLSYNLVGRVFCKCFFPPLFHIISTYYYCMRSRRLSVAPRFNIFLCSIHGIKNLN